MGNGAATYGNITPLMWLAQNGNIEGVKYLVEKGSDINIKDEDGQTALNYAEKGRNTEIVNYLIDKGSEINAKDSNTH